MNTTYLNEVINHEGCNPSSSPFRMDKEERNVSFIVLDVGYHEAKGNDDLFIEDNNTEVWILEALGEVNAWYLNLCRSKTG